MTVRVTSSGVGQCDLQLHHVVPSSEESAENGRIKLHFAGMVQYPDGSIA